MRHLTSFSILILVGLSIFMLSCSKDNNGPTAPETPNFEDISPYIWDYNCMLWFDLDYDTAKSGIADIDVMLTAKGAESTATLKVNSIPVVFDYEDRYTAGRIYSGGAYANGTIRISTTQPVTYEIVYNSTTYTGTMALPDEINGNFPAFVATNNYSPNWTLGTGNVPPNFLMINSMVVNDAGQELYSIRQMEGTILNDLIPSSFWSALAPITEFYYSVNPVVYKTSDSYQLLTVGMSSASYYWSATGKRPPVSTQALDSRIMQAIHNAVK